MPLSKIDQARNLIRQTGLLRPRDLASQQIPRKTLSYLLSRGEIERVGRGLYVLVDAVMTQHRSMAEAAKRVPRGVVCLLSALAYHEMTTQNPSQVWIAIGEKTWQPEMETPLIRTVRFSAAALEYGVEEHDIEGVVARIYNPAKTVADCFKYRNKIGMDVAIESLRDCLRQRKASVDQLLEAAQVCRVAKVMRPYLESLA